METTVSSRRSTGTAVAIAELRATTTGRITVPGDPGYDRARTVVYQRDRWPAAVVRARNTTDVVRTVRVAREHGMALAVRGGGHSPAGHGTTDAGIVLDLGDLKDIDIDVRGRTAWAGAGLTAGEYTAAVGAHGLATGFGDTGSVGIGGITLSGGIGLLVRRHSLTVDNLLAADVVTADGELRRVDAETHPDLFWAIRGGGGNFGIATRLRYRLHEVDTVVGGTMILPATPRILAAFLSAADDAPESLTTIVNVMPAAPHGELIIRATLVHAGGVRAGEHAVARFRALSEPLVDTVRPIRYQELLPPGDGGPHPTGAHRTMFLDDVDAESILAHLRRSDAPIPIVQLRVLGGAMARVPAGDTAYAHRTPRLLANVAALSGCPDELPARQAWVDGLTEELHRLDGVAAGFLGDEGQARVRAAYPAPTWQRLAETKRRYDPTNLFRLNQNIPPAPAPSVGGTSGAFACT
jgi:FAD/FMN-containing dehydrogenase